MVNKEPDNMTAPREKAFLLAAPEQRLLEALARRLPAWVLPDHLTVLALLAAVGFVAAGLAGAPWVAAALVVVHWLGDSLDGTLARVRRAERPRYGYYLDHLADALSTALIGLGLGLSGEMHLAIALALVVAYLAASINTYLETQAFGRLRLGYGRLGPTEARLFLLAGLVAVGAGVHVAVLGLSLLDVAGLAVTGALGVAVAVRAAGNLRTLARLEPVRR
jgi:phosphatidylglycerophosphate synthase